MVIKMKKTFYVMLMKEKVKLDIDKLITRAYACLLKVCISLFATYLAATHLIEIAYVERGYKAIGGEYMVIPVVFLVAYKLIGLVMKFLSAKAVKAWKKRK